MKYSALYSVVAGLALGAMLLPGTALAEKKTPFTATEADQTINFSFFPGNPPTMLYQFNGYGTFEMNSKESRVAGSGWFSAYSVWDTTVEDFLVAALSWGELHIVNAGGAWDGYFTGETATLVGSGDYEGLVSRWTCTSYGNKVGEWSGYIVENGPGDVPVKLSAWRNEQFVPIMFDANGNLVYAKSSLDAGGGQASHIGLFTDVRKIGLVNLRDGLFSATGTLAAPNGDLLNWVVFGEVGAEIQPSGLKIFFAGGTGRFEHLVGSVAGQMEYLSMPVSYTYEATGKLRY